MEKLGILRNKIDQIDQDIAKLFVDRMEVVQDIVEYKKERGLSIEDGAREASSINQNSSYIQDDVLKSYYMNFFKNTLEVSKQYQYRLLKGLKIACSGVEGAYAHIAGKKIFPTSQFQFFPDFLGAYQSVEQGICDCCILPIENSYAGEVTQVTDLMYSGNLFITGLYDLEIRHSLLGLPDANIKDIKTVISHPQALKQCEGYLTDHKFNQMSQTNTAISARMVSELQDKSMAAIASSENAELYGLKVLDHDINESSTNTTRFAVFSRVQSKYNRQDSRFIMVFNVRNEAGALAKAINIIGECGFNMQVLRSRPIKDEPWQYYFFVEAEGDAYGTKAHVMLYELGKQCTKVKIVGSFPKEVKL